MAGSQPLALQLEQLLNPRPREADPEADPEEGEAALGTATCARSAVGPPRCTPGWHGGVGQRGLLTSQPLSPEEIGLLG